MLHLQHHPEGYPDAAVPPAPPLRTALKPAWVDYAQAIGIDRSLASAMSKTDLIVAIEEKIGLAACGDTQLSGGADPGTTSCSWRPFLTT